MTRGPERIVVLACVLGLVGALGWYVVLRPEPVLRIAAEFTTVDGIFPGSRVAVLGVPVGTVESVDAAGATVRVTMSLPEGTAVAEDAHAYVMSPAVVSDRFVELAPAHTGGPVLRDGAVIPVRRTHSPITWNELSDSLHELLTALGPGAPGEGEGLGDLVHSGARSFGGNGQKIRDAVTGIATATDLVADGTGDIGAVLDDVDRLTRLLVEHGSTVDSVTATVAEAARDFAGQQDVVAESIGQLSRTLAALSRLLDEHGAELTGDLAQLTELSTTLVARQQELAETLDTLPLALDNFGRAVTDDQRLRIRLDISTNLAQFPATARLCARIPLPLCSGAGIVNPIPFPPHLPDALGLDAAMNGGGR
ncbi:phospholipid/cholesterol/gamma-HCH transport system substrate-binding protein [Amycolatopsis marina]|uniref:Phospholipid/cholesterol/gamma-HCH transport system substrate-binding protein n=1 Tax=Amycolatopsis marina TaxID=490629 RepID=A0A1I0ZUE4_9PSEU|nr:MCE family protein [Amycolatopsis marina]SFB28922.1 phospholipid/cholesterol/gamma-HCH transport system substrate-binding protein [Amycolatopsis marina]